jgi:hypothetical protein
LVRDLIPDVVLPSSRRPGASLHRETQLWALLALGNIPGSWEPAGTSPLAIHLSFYGISISNYWPLASHERSRSRQGSHCRSVAPNGIRRGELLCVYMMQSLFHRLSNLLASRNLVQVVSSSFCPPCHEKRPEMTRNLLLVLLSCLLWLQVEAKHGRIRKRANVPSFCKLATFIWSNWTAYLIEARHAGSMGWRRSSGLHACK